MRFGEMEHHGRKLRKNATWEEIQAFEKRAEKQSLTTELAWVIEWIKATYYYRKQDYKNSHKHYSSAFELGKYTAGQLQYLLVNQYVESCAKTENLVKFKKGVAWAKYIGLEIRFIRDKPETEEVLEFAYTMLKFGNYPIH